MIFSGRFENEKWFETTTKLTIYLLSRLITYTLPERLVVGGQMVAICCYDSTLYKQSTEKSLELQHVSATPPLLEIGDGHLDLRKRRTTLKVCKD